MGRLPRSLLVYIVASSLYAAAVFLAVHVIYAVELGRAGVRIADPEDLIGSIDIVSFAVWIGISLIAAAVLYRLAAALEGVRGSEEHQRGEIASIFAMGQALTASLDLEEIASRFLEAARVSLDSSIRTSLYVLDDNGDGLRRLGGAQGREQALWPGTLSADGVPAPIRTRVMDHRQPLLIPDTDGNAAWPPIERSLADGGKMRSFAAIPLVSHERLVGVVAFAADHPNALVADRLQGVTVIAQFVAAAVRTALSLREAERRADREAIANRVSQRARSSLDPDQVLAATVKELGGALRVQRVIAALGSSAAQLRVAHEWVAEGVVPVGIGSSDLPAGRQAATSLRTAQITDDYSRLATPIIVAGELAGVLGLYDEPTRDWSIDDVRLVEAVARELRGAMEAARLFQARQRENERLLALQRASTVMASRSTTRDVIDEVLRTASSLLGKASASLYLRDDTTEALRLAQNADPTKPVSANLVPGHGAGDLLRRLEPVVVNDYQAWTGATQLGREAGCTALLAVPLVRSGQLIGAVVLRSYDAHTHYALDDARLLGLFGDQAVAALTNAEAFERQRRAMEELEKVNRAKSEFVSIVSHEFRTPLTGIQGFSEMMRDEDLPSAEMKEYAADINKDAQRLSRLINDMLDLSRMESGRMTLDRETTDLNAIVADVAERIRPHAPQHPISLELDPSVPALVADRDRLTQVVSNLLSNAVKYSPTGGAILVATKREGDRVHLAVRDHGMGIPPEALESIWEQFSRVESRDTKGIQGTGLGLPIVRQIVTMHGGSVWAESEVGRGSTFHVLLPLAATIQPVEA